MSREEMTALIRAMFRKEKAIWRLWGPEGAGKLAEVEQAERVFEQTVSGGHTDGEEGRDGLEARGGGHAAQL